MPEFLYFVAKIRKFLHIHSFEQLVLYQEGRAGGRVEIASFRSPQDLIVLSSGFSRASRAREQTTVIDSPN
jgi:hypothetical protein